MGRKSTQTDRRARRYIRIEDDKKWDLIDKLMTLDEYKNSFNRLINDALEYGLPKLCAAEFGLPEQEQEETPKPQNPIENDVIGDSLLTLIRLVREVIVNENINKSIVCSLFQLRELELEGTVAGKQFSKGHFQETPNFILDYEIRELKKLRD